MSKLFISIFVKLSTFWVPLCVLCFLAIFFLSSTFLWTSGIFQLGKFDNFKSFSSFSSFVLMFHFFYFFIFLVFLVDVLQLLLFFIFVMNFHNHDIAFEVVSFYHWRCWTFQPQLCASCFLATFLLSLAFFWMNGSFNS